MIYKWQHCGLANICLGVGDRDRQRVVEENLKISMINVPLHVNGFAVQDADLYHNVC